MRDPVDTAGHELDADAQRKVESERRRQEVEDFKWLMAHKQGRRFVWRLLAEAGVYRTSFTGNSTTFFNEGKRNLGLLLVGEIHELTPDAYGLMLKEQRTNDN